MKDEKLDIISKINAAGFMYMPKEKREFLYKINEKSPKKTTLLYIAVLNKIDDAEHMFGREWMYFSESMVDSAIVGFSSKSIITLQSYISIIKDYLVATTPKTDVALRGYLYTISLVKEDLLSEEKGYINKIGEKMQYITEEELDSMIEKKASPSSKVLAILLFNGVKGSSFRDIGNIKMIDVDLENNIIKREDGSVLMAIPDKYSSVFRDALNEDIYIEYDYSGNVINESPLVSKSEYLIRRTAYRLYDGTDPIDANICNKRIKAFGKATGNPHVTPTSIYNAGLTLKLTEECGWNEPTWTQVDRFKKKYDVKLSYTSVKSIYKVLENKLTSPCK